MTDDTVLACPDCDGASLETAGDGYYCHSCYSKIDEAIERERRQHTGRRGLAGRLADADPEEVRGL